MLNTICTTKGHIDKSILWLSYIHFQCPLVCFLETNVKIGCLLEDLLSNAWMKYLHFLHFRFFLKIWMLCWVCKGNDANLSKIELYCYFWPTLQMLLTVNVKVCCIKAMSENMKIANVSNRNMKMYQTASFSAANSDIVFLLQP